ncbi:MAG: hypothetical protein JW795_16800 [Chitinivibrionales bacterium]|nr:hypothetical protein [Chitinivibrionales bacterium]
MNDTATENAGYCFDGWSVTAGVIVVDGDSTGRFTITDNGTVQANF